MYVIDDSNDKSDRPSPSAPGNQAMYLSLLRSLLGEEVQKLVRDELQAVLLLAAPAGNSSAPGPGSPPPTANVAHLAKGKTGVPEFERPSDKTPTQQLESNLVQEMIHSSSIANLSKVLDQTEESDEDQLAAWPSWVRGSMLRLSARLERWGTQQAPNQPRCLKGVVEGFVWGALVNVVILLHCAFMVYAIDYQVRNYTEEQTTGSFFFWVDMCFLGFYTAELILKFATYGWYYFKDVNWKSNLFDFILVVISMQSMIFTVFLSSSGNFDGLRVLRLLRMLKALRVLRLAAHFHTMRAIMESLESSFSTLLWSLCTMALVYFMFSLVFVSRVAAYLNAEAHNLDEQEAEALMANYGSVKLAIISLVMASTGGKDWGEDYDLMGYTGALSQCFFLFFICFIQIALLNIILGIFVDDAMKALQPDDYSKAHALALEDKRIEKELQDMCAEVDLNGSGLLNIDEWNQIMCHKKKRDLLEMMGLPAHHVHQYFHMMCKGNVSKREVANVEIKEFINGCMKLRGSASPFDGLALSFEIASMKEILLKEIKLLSEIRFR